METKQITALDEPAIWLGCLSCYNNGRLNGKWISAEMATEPEAAETLNGLAEQVQVNDYTASRCRKCFGDEFDVMDYQLIPKSCANTKEFYENAEQLNELHNTDQLALIVMLAENIDTGGHMDLDELIRYHETNYAGEFDSAKEFGEDYAEQVGDLDAVPEHMRNYIDWEHYATELLYDYWETAGHYWRSV
jgi:antirestriction protein